MHYAQPMPSTPGAMRPPSTVLLAGTAKGLFRFESHDDRRGWQHTGFALQGHEVLQAWLDPRDPSRGFAVTDHPVWGSHVHASHDAGHSWAPLPGVPQHADTRHGRRLRRVWSIAPGPAAQPQRLYAGIDPAGLFLSEDLGQTWTALPGLNEHPTRGLWEPARGGFSVHSIQCDPDVPGRVHAAVSAGGAYASDNDGVDWRPLNRGVAAPNRPPGEHVAGHNIHRLWRHPARPGRLYRQCYSGVYRSDDGGEHWIDISAGLPSGFGYALSGEPADPDSVYVVPIESQDLRTVCDARLRVYRSRDAGAHWEALGEGLPQALCYVTVLREALACDGVADAPGFYLGTSGGQLYASRDAGDHWQALALFLPRVLAVSACTVGGAAR